jgi:hypothetical protein
MARSKVLGQRIVGFRTVGGVDHQPEPAQRDGLGELELGIIAHRLDVGRQHPLDQVEAAGTQVGQAHGRIDDRQVGDPVDEDLVLVPVVRELLDDDAVLLDAFDELVRAGADGMEPELVARGFGGLGRHHHAGTIGELGEQRRERLLEQQLDGQWTLDLDLFDRADLGPAEGGLHEEVAVEAVLCGLGIERLTVVEFHAGPELDRDRLAVRRGLVAQRQLRDDVHFLVDVEELVAHRGQDDSGRVASGQRRIERVRIVTQPDPQLRLGKRGVRQQ